MFHTPRRIMMAWMAPDAVLATPLRLFCCFFNTLEETEKTQREALRCAKLKALHPPLPSILLVSVQFIENLLDRIRQVSFQCDMRNRDILCSTKTWLTPQVQDQSSPFNLLYFLCRQNGGVQNIQRRESLFYDQ